MRLSLISVFFRASFVTAYAAKFIVLKDQSPAARDADTRQEAGMTPVFRILAASVLLIAVSGGAALVQKRGGVLKMYNPDSPASMSVLEEVTVFAMAPMAGVFNNLVMADQHVKQVSLDSIVPDLATGWSWNEDGTALSFALRGGVRWHDERPFTAQDVKCTWDLIMDTAPEKLRVNPRKQAWSNLDRVITRGNYEITFHLKAAARSSDASRDYSNLPLSCIPARDAAASDRNRTVQIRRVQPERTYQADSQPAVLEKGPALPRRHRLHDHSRPLDSNAGFRLGEVRHDIPQQPFGPAPAKRA